MNYGKREVTILIPTRFDSRYMLELCLESVKKYTADYPYKIIVGDAGVDDQTRKFLESRTDIKLVKPEDQALPKDSMIRFVNTPYFLFLHDDTQILKNGWLEKRVALMEKHPRNAIVGAVVANFVYGWKIRFLWKKTMRRFWPLALLVRTDVQRELGLRWGVTGKYDTGGMAYQQFTSQAKYRFVPCKFHKEVRHFGGMTWPVKKKVQREDVEFDIDNVVEMRNRKLNLIKETLLSKNY
ncbi:MAG: glycosyltransferase [Candidatus Omnitrophota bacterium]